MAIKHILLIAAAILCSGSLMAKESSQIACYQVQGMTCAACSVTLKTAVRKLSGIESIQVSVGENTAQVVFDPSKTNADDIKKQIDSTGYKATSKQCKS